MEKIIKLELLRREQACLETLKSLALLITIFG